MSAQAQPLLTVEQYLEIDRASEARHEYYNGRMYAMSRGSYRRSRIITRFASLLDALLIGRGCDVMSNDLKVSAENFYFYPDIVVICGEPKFADDRTDIITNPLVVIEVLSPSTEAYDRGFKASRCRAFESLREHIIVSQVEPRIEVMYRSPAGRWAFSEFLGIDALCRLESIQCEIPLAKIYERIRFDAEEQARAATPSAE